MNEESKKEIETAVALKYDKEEDKAPKIIAKGRGEIAEKIIEVAKELNIPIHYDPDLANILVKLDIGVEIPERLYMVVAEILAFVYKMNYKYPIEMNKK